MAKKKRKPAAQRLAEKRAKHAAQCEIWKSLDSDKGCRDLMAAMQSQGWVLSERVAVLGRPRREYAILSATHPQYGDTHVVKAEKRAYVKCWATRRAAWSAIFDAIYKTGSGGIEPPDPTDSFDDLFAELDSDAGDD